MKFLPRPEIVQKMHMAADIEYSLLSIVGSVKHFCALFVLFYLMYS
jgi:hypothetical protein